MKIYATMMVYNDLPFLDHVFELLSSFCNHIVLMDNGSTDGSREWVARPREQVTTILGSQADPPHYANLRNKMLQFVPDGAWVLKWDPDELPSQGMVYGLRAFLEADKGQHDGWKVPMYHLMKSKTTCAPHEFEKPMPILFRRGPGVQYYGAIHERIALENWGIIAPSEGIAFIHLSYFAEARLRRKAEYYARVNPTRFPTASTLTDRLNPTPAPLPDHIVIPADDAWLEKISKAE